VAGERVLVNFFYAHPVGHAVEALAFAHGHHRADPTREISLALSAATPVELAHLCPWVAGAHAVDHPFLEPCDDSAARIGHLPRDWDWVLDDVRRHLPPQLELFPGMRDYYAATDAHLRAASGRRVAGFDPPSYVPHAGLRLELPEAAAAAARAELGDGAPRIAIMPAGSSPRALYPSRASWELILDALDAEFPGARFVLVGRMARDARTSTSLAAGEHAALLAHRSAPLDAFDRPLLEQLALVEACDVFLAPHTGFGMAALAVGTPWLTLSGGRWYEYFFNRVPFRSILPDTARHPSFTQFEEPPLVDDDGPRTPAMTQRRIREDLDRLLAGARELIAGELAYEDALATYFSELSAVVDPDTIWSIDRVHLEHL
jgi:hypothetical protein